MAGHLLFNYFKENNLYDTWGIARNITPQDKIFSIDVSDTDALSKIIKDYNFDYVVNCIGF